jgi:ABC-type dipeptide/oligopeptide/nickel transport system permease subunit
VLGLLIAIVGVIAVAGVLLGMAMARVGAEADRIAERVLEIEFARVAEEALIS